MTRRLLLAVLAVALAAQACEDDAPGATTATGGQPSTASSATGQGGSSSVSSGGAGSGGAPACVGALVADRANPRFFRYAGGGPFYLCGPGDPEDFLYRGTRNPDGTRTGDQLDLIDKAAGTGVNGIYFQAIRSHGGDGPADHNPFEGSDPSNGLDDDILAQWETWFSTMQSAGISLYFIFYDDSACVWGCNGDAVPPEEDAFLRAIVDRFEHHPLVTWVIAEEYSEAFSPARASAMAAVIRDADDCGRPIAVHKLGGLTFNDFADDPYVDQFSIQTTTATPSETHDQMVSAFGTANGRYNLNLAELHGHGTGVIARHNHWAAAMGGAYVMQLGMDIASTPVADLEDCGRLVAFMEQTNFDIMQPLPAQVAAGTEFVLGNPNDAFILYASQLAGEMGVANIDAGTYDFTWYDAVSGQTVEQQDVPVAAGSQSWPAPAPLGSELAVWIRQRP